MWEVWSLAVLIALGFGVAIGMARKYKARVVETPQTNIDVETLAMAVAKAVAREVLANLSKGGVSTVKSGDNIDIQIDESIIPIAIDAAIEAVNLVGMTKEEKAVDKDLEKSKAKLADIFKKRS